MSDRNQMEVSNVWIIYCILTLYGNLALKLDKKTTTTVGVVIISVSILILFRFIVQN